VKPPKWASMKTFLEVAVSMPRLPGIFVLAMVHIMKHISVPSASQQRPFGIGRLLQQCHMMPVGIILVRPAPTPMLSHCKLAGIVMPCHVFSKSFHA